MRKLVITTFLTLDGIMQAPGGPEEDPTGKFAYGGWSVNYWDDSMNQMMGEAMAQPSEMLLGRKTYEIFASHWPYSEEPGADELNSAKKYVATKTLDHANWNNSTLLKGDVVKQIRQLKQQDGPELLVQGSSDLIQTLLQNNLVDELRLWIFPVVIGQGKRLFGDGTVPSSLKLIDIKTSDTGVIMAVYQPVGPIQFGSFELEQPSAEELERRRRMDTQG
jgi:dihydrofolate reductase